MKTIRLDIGKWKYDPKKQLGPEGSFGVVYVGTGEGDGQVAIKKLKISAREAAHRELKIARELSGRRLKNIIPVFDSGLDADSECYFVVMSLAEKSLQEEFKNGEKVNDVEAAKILLDIANGLSEVSDIVHRDLKPGNILYHKGKWKIADFGIARFIEASTSLQTLKGCLTPQYAAPEQWRFEHSTGATDIYALGCIGYFLLTGQAPFHGPRQEDYKQQHLCESPPQLENHRPQLCSLLLIMLRKAPEARPDLNRVKKILEDVSKGDDAQSYEVGLGALARAGAEAAALEATEEAKWEAERSQKARRKQIAREALRILITIAEKMVARIKLLVPAAKCSVNLEGMEKMKVSIGQASLEIRRVGEVLPLPQGAFSQCGWDVVVGAIIKVGQSDPQYEWSASLWYSKLPTDDNYRWREVSYFFSQLMPPQNQYEPFAITNPKEADDAAAQIMGIHQIAFGPRPIDDENFEKFCERWSDLLAKAVNGKLSHPRRLPLQ